MWVTNLPLGLEESEIWRACDRELRELLGDSDGEWVTPPPVQALLDAPSFVEANMIYLDLFEKELSVSTWAMVPRVRQIREWAGARADTQKWLYQCHPERVLMKLNGQKIFQHPETRRGLRHRLDLLTDLDERWMDLYRETKEEFRRNEIEELEILNLLTLAHAGTRIVMGEGELRPESADLDDDGFPKAVLDL